MHTDIRQQFHEPVTSRPITLLRTKLYRPPTPPDYVPRLQLQERLSAQHDQAFTLVSAPAGFGKTTLLSAWLAQSESPSAWLSLEEKDNDLVTFLSYLIASIQTIFPHGVSATQTLLEATTVPPLRVLASSLINELDELDESFILVLDDYHVIQAVPIHKLLTALITHPPRPLHLVIASRYDPPLALSRLRTQERLIEIRAEELRFSLQETETLLFSILDANADAEAVRIIHAKTEGWVAGLRLALLSLRLKGHDQAQLNLLPPRDRLLVDYLAREVFAKQPSAIQKFLLETSILDRFNGSLSESVTLLGGDEVRDGQACLAWLEKHELFIVSLDASGEWFRLHYLFRDFLQQRLAEAYSSTDIATLHRRACRWFAEQNLIEEALQHALAGGDVLHAAALVEEHRHVLLDEYRITQLENWLQLLPPTLIEQRPALLLAQAWVAWHRGKMADVISLVERAADLVAGLSTELPGTASLKGEIAALRSFQLYWMGEFIQSFEQAQLALEITPHQMALIRATGRMFLAVGYQMQGDLQRVSHVVQDGLTETRSKRAVQLRDLFTLFMTQWVSADLTQVRNTTSYALELDKNHDYPELIHWANFFLGSVHYQRNELSEAERYLRRVVEQPYLAFLTCLAQSSFVLALTYQAQNRSEQANAIMDTLQSFASETGNLSILLAMQAFRAELELQQGRDREAVQWAGGVPAAAPPLPTPLFYSQWLTLPKVLLAQNTAASRQTSAALLTHLREFNERTHNVYALLQVLAVQAVLYQADGNQSLALETLERAISLAEPGGFIRLFVDLGAPVQSLLQRLAQRGVSPAYLTEILAAFGAEQQIITVVDPTTSSSALLTNREQEVLELLARRYTDKEIAEALSISTETVRSHLTHMGDKLGARGRRAIVKAAKAQGLLT